MNNKHLSSPYDLEAYQYQLPPEMIAQHPVSPRDAARLLVLERSTGLVHDRGFRHSLEYLDAGDTLVLNETRVMPARLYAVKETGAQVEILLLKKSAPGWEVLVKPARRVKPGTLLYFPGHGDVRAEIIDELDLEGGRRLVFVNCPDEDKFIDQVGHMPLPPYIHRADEARDHERYQTVYARRSGSAAAPTAGLHFTPGLLQEIQDKGVNVATILLHVGLGTFRPVKQEDIRRHQMHREYYEVDASTAALLNQTRQKGHRVIAVGTTVVRTLESIHNSTGGYQAGRGETCIFIYPGYKIRSIDSLITNFHLPGSTLIMLVAAFAGLKHTMQAYDHAVANSYRFFSYGDAMLIL